jgi:hypothetical protein
MKDKKITFFEERQEISEKEAIEILAELEFVPESLLELTGTEDSFEIIESFKEDMKKTIEYKIKNSELKKEAKKLTKETIDEMKEKICFQVIGSSFSEFEKITKYIKSTKKSLEENASSNEKDEKIDYEMQKMVAIDLKVAQIKFAQLSSKIKNYLINNGFPIGVMDNNLEFKLNKNIENIIGSVNRFKKRAGVTELTKSSTLQLFKTENGEDVFYEKNISNKMDEESIKKIKSLLKKSNSLLGIEIELDNINLKDVEKTIEKIIELEQILTIESFVFKTRELGNYCSKTKIVKGLFFVKNPLRDNIVAVASEGGAESFIHELTHHLSINNGIDTYIYNNKTIKNMGSRCSIDKNDNSYEATIFKGNYSYYINSFEIAARTGEIAYLLKRHNFKYLSESLEDNSFFSNESKNLKNGKVLYVNEDGKHFVINEEKIKEIEKLLNNEDDIEDENKKEIKKQIIFNIMEETELFDYNEEYEENKEFVTKNGEVKRLNAKNDGLIKPFNKYIGNDALTKGIYFNLRTMELDDLNDVYNYGENFYIEQDKMLVISSNKSESVEQAENPKQAKRTINPLQYGFANVGSEKELEELLNNIPNEMLSEREFLEYINNLFSLRPKKITPTNELKITKIKNMLKSLTNNSKNVKDLLERNNVIVDNDVLVVSRNNFEKSKGMLNRYFEKQGKENVVYYDGELSKEVIHKITKNILEYGNTRSNQMIEYDSRTNVANPFIALKIIAKSILKMNSKEIDELVLNVLNGVTKDGKKEMKNNMDIIYKLFLETEAISVLDPNKEYEGKKIQKAFLDNLDLREIFNMLNNQLSFDRGKVKQNEIALKQLTSFVNNLQDNESIIKLKKIIKNEVYKMKESTDSFSTFLTMMNKYEEQIIKDRTIEKIKEKYPIELITEDGVIIIKKMNEQTYYEKDFIKEIMDEDDFNIYNKVILRNNKVSNWRYSNSRNLVEFLTHIFQSLKTRIKESLLENDGRDLLFNELLNSEKFNVEESILVEENLSKKSVKIEKTKNQKITK